MISKTLTKILNGPRTREQLSALLRQGVELLAQVGDSKWDFIWDEILSRVGDDQVVLFAQPIETVTALSNYLSRKTGKKPALIIGGQTDAAREEEIECFGTAKLSFLFPRVLGQKASICSVLIALSMLMFPGIPWRWSNGSGAFTVLVHV